MGAKKMANQAGVSVTQMAQITGKDYRTLMRWADTTPNLFMAVAYGTVYLMQSDRHNEQVKQVEQVEQFVK